MAINKVDYDVLEQASTTYGNEAAAIDDVIRKLDSMNGTLQEGWQNQTAEAFINRYETEHKKALMAARDSINEISQYIKNYRAKAIDNDTEGANAVRG